MDLDDEGNVLGIFWKIHLLPNDMIVVATLVVINWVTIVVFVPYAWLAAETFPELTWFSIDVSRWTNKIIY